MPDSKHGSESVCPGAEVGDGTEIFKSRALLLNRVFHRVAVTVDANFLGMDFHSLTTTDRFHELSFDPDARSGRDPSQQCLIEVLDICHYLYIVYA